MTGFQQVKEETQNQSTSKRISSSDFVNSVPTSTTKEGKDNYLQTVIMKFFLLQSLKTTFLLLEHISEKHGVALCK